MTRVYFSDLLPVRHRSFYNGLTTLLIRNNVEHALLPGTKDIWCRDYMPVPTKRNGLVQFTYEPSYLNTALFRNTITDPQPITDRLQWSCIASSIRLDGGNVVQAHNKVLMCDRVFRENPEITGNELINQLENLLEAEIIILPSHPHDLFGHTDGIVRWYNDRTVLINDLSQEPAAFRIDLLNALSGANISYIEVPVNFTGKSAIDATGLYLNYLATDQLIVLPEFNLPQDQEVFDLFSLLYPHKKVEVINSLSIAREGGVLNCVSWNADIIKKDKQPVSDDSIAVA